MDIYIWALAISVIIDSAAIIALVLIGHAERKDLYDRLMCDSAAEYKQLHAEPKTRPEPRQTKILKEWRNGNSKQD